MTRIATRFGLGVVGAGAVVASLIAVAPAQAVPAVPAAPIHGPNLPFDVIASLNGSRGAGSGGNFVARNQQLELKDCTLDAKQASSNKPDRDVSLVGPYHGETAECQTGSGP
jgi:hypothetical protein